MAGMMFNMLVLNRIKGLLPKSKDKKEDEDKEEADDGGGGDDGMDEGELNSELAMQEYERKRRHLRAEAEREKRRKDTRSKFRLKEKPSVMTSMMQAEMNAPPPGSNQGKRKSKPFYQQLLSKTFFCC